MKCSSSAAIVSASMLLCACAAFDSMEPSASGAPQSAPTTAPAAVYAPASAPASAPAAIPPRVAPSGDTDNDGVADGVDQCPATSAGTLVDRRGCAVLAPSLPSNGN